MFPIEEKEHNNNKQICNNIFTYNPQNINVEYLNDWKVPTNNNAIYQTSTLLLLLLNYYKIYYTHQV